MPSHKRGVLIAAGVIALATGLSLVRSIADRPSSAPLKHPFAAKLSAQDVAGNRGEPGEDVKAGENPIGAEEQNFLEHAYPASDVPFQATVNALTAWKQLKGKSNKGKNTVGQWTLAGPSTANYPGVLSFSGAAYTASGRVTGLAIDPSCTPNECRLWVAAAGGGIWRTENVSGSGSSWKFLSGSFGTNAIGTLIYDNGVLYAGTGESHASGDSEAGLGIWKSTDGGDTWTKLASLVTNLTTTSCGLSDAAGACVVPVPNGTYTGDAFAGRSISSIVVDPTDANVLYVSSTRGVRGVSSVTGGATTNPTPPRPPFGLFKSTDGGATFSFIWDGNASVRGVNRVVLDPSDPSTVYAAAYQQGVWRSIGGGSFAQLRGPIAPAFNTDRAEFALAELPNGKTRMYVGDGAQGAPPAAFFRTDDAAGVASFSNMTTAQNSDYCTGQCWYDNVVYSPPGKPDVVYLGGSFSYGQLGGPSNGRGFIYSTDGGASFTDMTWDASPASAPDGMHPDSHAVVEIPGTNAAIFGSDGGVVRSSGAFANVSAQCAGRGLSGSNLALCQQLLSRVPTHLHNLNTGLSTLQFQSLSVASDNPKHLQGGTQDNGTFQTTGSSVVWPQIIYGDGGQSGFSAGDSSLRFNSFFGQFHDANFRNGAPTKWVIISGKIAASPEGSNFYAPIIADPHPANAGTIFEGSQSVWRTQDWGGDQAFLEANCPEFTTSGANPACGDFERIGPSGASDLTAVPTVPDYRGTTRGGGFVAAIERAPSDTETLWVATNAGRVFISKNADAAAGAVTYTRIDTLSSATADPGRFVSGIYVDPANPNHAWISYSGYNFNTPAQPGHVFSVLFDPAVPDATWTKLDGTSFPDFPATDIVRDSNGDLYASTDFGVMRLPNGSSGWEVAGTGLPQVEVAGLTIATEGRKLYAATHGRSAWQLTLP